MKTSFCLVVENFFVAIGCCLKWKCCSQQHKISTDGATPTVSPSGGCRKKYTCCGNGPEAQGCENLFPCCGRNRNQEGCLEVNADHV